MARRRETAVRVMLTVRRTRSTTRSRQAPPPPFLLERRAAARRQQRTRARAAVLWRLGGAARAKRCTAGGGRPGWAAQRASNAGAGRWPAWSGATERGKRAASSG